MSGRLPLLSTKFHKVCRRISIICATNNAFYSFSWILSCFPSSFSTFLHLLVQPYFPITNLFTLEIDSKKSEPPSSFQAVDVYLGFCYLIVVLALIEYAIVAYSKKKHDDKMKKSKKKSIFETRLQIQTPDLLKGSVHIVKSRIAWFPIPMIWL